MTVQPIHALDVAARTTRTAPGATPRAPHRASSGQRGVTPAPVVRLLPSPEPDPLAPAAPGVTPGWDHVEIDPELRRMTGHWVERYVRTALEIVAGERPASHVTRHTKPSVHHDLTRRALLATRAGAGPRRPGIDDALPRATVRGLHLSFLSRGVVEASAVVRHGDTHRAVACRFEWLRDRWTCTALDFC